MIEKSELRKLAKARLKDSKNLCEAKRYDGAVYICGYVIELGLKLRICKTLNWEGFPSTSKELIEKFKAIEKELSEEKG